MELEGSKARLLEAEALLGAKQAELDGEQATLSALLIEAKMASAQHAYERDEAKAKAKGLRDELQHVVVGGKKVAQHATKLEVKYEELRAKYDEDLSSLIELRLRSAEDRARLAEYEAAEKGGAGAPPPAKGRSVF